MPKVPLFILSAAPSQTYREPPRGTAYRARRPQTRYAVPLTLDNIAYRYVRCCNRRMEKGSPLIEELRRLGGVWGESQITCAQTRRMLRQTLIVREELDRVRMKMEALILEGIPAGLHG